MFEEDPALHVRAGESSVFARLRAMALVLLLCSNSFASFGQAGAGQSTTTGGQPAGAGAGSSTSTPGTPAGAGSQSAGQSPAPSTLQMPQGRLLGQPQNADRSTQPQMGDRQSNTQNSADQPDNLKDQQREKSDLKEEPPQVEEQKDSSGINRQESPYPDFPALQDLYFQIPGVSGVRLARFGSSFFNTAGGNAADLPEDLPVGPDYVLGTGDTLTVNVWGSLSDRLSLPIDRQGQIALPEVGSLMVSGMTIAAAQAAMEHALAKQFEHEKVEIALEKVHTVRVYVVGEVQRPGAYDVSALSTPLNALVASGGPTSRGSLRIMRILRAQQLVRQIDLYSFLLKGVHTNEERLLPGDTIVVPTAGPQVTVDGAVRRPAIYELAGENDLNSVLDLAGGVTISASLKQIEVDRIVANEKHTSLSLQLPPDMRDIEQKLASFTVQDGDAVFIKVIMANNEQAVYLDGHVYLPGKYAYREGMTVTDILHSYQEVLPEPADYAELVRLQAPDFHPVILSFSLRDVLLGNVTMPLRPYDMVRIYGRYVGDGPRVTINGEVGRPGTYPMFEGMRIADLLRLAGGFKRSAYRDEADLTSYTVQNGTSITANHATVQIEKALNGDKSADVLLKAGDVLNVKTLEGWQDIGAAITISGEVQHAGGYGILPGERLSSVLKRAGGFRADAYPYAAVFQRQQVAQLAQQARDQLIQRIEQTPVEVNRGAMTASAATDMREQLLAQKQDILASLRGHPADGRMVITITSDIRSWENTPADIELQAGDTLMIPKRPSFVQISGQVYNPIAVAFSPGKSVGWYLSKAGGATPNANKGDIYVLRADGSIVPRGGGWLTSGFRDVELRRGDVIFVPEKIAGTSAVWQNLIGAAQVLSAAAMPIAIAIR